MGRPRTLARPGLSLVDANQGRLITYQDDVLDIKRQIEKDLWPGLLSCVFDTETEEWVIIEHCKDGTDRLCFTTPALSQATIDKIRRADQASRDYEDPNTAYERADREEEREKDRSLAEHVGQHGERLYFALRKDGLIHAPKVYLSNSGPRVRGVT